MANKAKRVTSNGWQTQLETLFVFGCRCAEVANSEVWQTLDSLVRFQSPVLTIKTSVGAVTPTEALSRTAEAARFRKNIIRLSCADFHIKGVHHERT